MSQENVELVRRVFEGGPEVQSLLVGGSDLTGHPWLSLFHPECVVEEIAEVPDSGAYHGREGVVRFFQRGFREVWDEWRFVPLEIIQGPDGVFAAVDNSGRSKTGAEVQMTIFQAFRVREGMIIYVTAYMDRQQALKAVGLSE
jgi:ketosteroid isomerase-like protein